MSNTHNIDKCWASQNPTDWAAEYQLCICHLQTALPLPNLPSKHLNKFDAAFKWDNNPWPFTITNNPNDFPEILYKLNDMHQHSSTSWAYGSYWYYDGVHPGTALMLGREDLLDIGHLNYVAINHADCVIKQAKLEWECIEAKKDAFMSEQSLYNVHIFAVLLLAVVALELRECIKWAAHSDVCLLNNGPFVMLSLYQLLFPMQDVYENVLCTHLKNITIATCDNNYYKYTKKFIHCFQSVGPFLSISNINVQWTAFHTQLKLYPNLVFCDKFTSDLIQTFHKFCGICSADTDINIKQCIAALIKIVSESKSIHLT